MGPEGREILGSKEKERRENEGGREGQPGSRQPVTEEAERVGHTEGKKGKQP